jgi:hypothetical protein
MKEIDINKLTKEFMFNIKMGLRYKYESCDFEGTKDISFILEPIEDEHYYKAYIDGLYNMKICKANLIRMIFENLYHNSSIGVSFSMTARLSNIEMTEFNFIDVMYRPASNYIGLNFIEYDQDYLNRSSNQELLNPYPFDYIFEKDENGEDKYNWRPLLLQEEFFHNNIINNDKREYLVL